MRSIIERLRQLEALQKDCTPSYAGELADIREQLEAMMRPGATICWVEGKDGSGFELSSSDCGFWSYAEAEAWLLEKRKNPGFDYVRLVPVHAKRVPCPYCLEYERGSDGRCVCDKPECRRKAAEAEAIHAALVKRPMKIGDKITLRDTDMMGLATATVVETSDPLHAKVMVEVLDGEFREGPATFFVVSRGYDLNEEGDDGVSLMSDGSGQLTYEDGLQLGVDVWPSA